MTTKKDKTALDDLAQELDKAEAQAQEYARTPEGIAEAEKLEHEQGKPSPDYNPDTIF